MPKLMVVLLFCTLAAVGQRPVINPQGVVNGASFGADPERGSLVVGGAIFSLFGQNLATSALAASGTPLPTTLGGTSVTVGGIQAPLFYVSPSQINLQVPNGVHGGPVRVVVTSTAGASEPVLVAVVLDAVGIFTQGSRGCGQGAVLNVAADGSVTLNTPENSVSPGSFVSVYGTGLGSVYFPPADGHPASADRLSYIQSVPNPLLGLETFDRLAYSPGPGGGVTYAGRAPGLVGVDQVNLRIPEDAPEGCAVPLKLQEVTSTSQPVTISIRQGGGACQDAPEARFAVLRWQKVVASGPEPGAVSTQERFAGLFGAAPENQAVPLPDPVPRTGWLYGRLTRPPGPRCKEGAPRGLDAGALTLEGLPTGPLVVSPTPSFGQLNYAATLPPGSIQGREVRVGAVGGPDVGAFEAALSIPAPIQITRALPPGTIIRNSEPFRVSWTNGTSDAVVRMRLIARIPNGEEPGAESAALASDGEATIGLRQVFDSWELPVLPNDNAEVVIIVSPRAGKVQTFAAPGLTREGRHEWSYEFRFTGLKIRSQ